MRLSHLIRQVRHICAEMDAAQRILFEQRTGVPSRRPPRLTVEELESLYALEHPEPTSR